MTNDIEAALKLEMVIENVDPDKLDILHHLILDALCMVVREFNTYIGGVSSLKPFEYDDEQNDQMMALMDQYKTGEDFLQAAEQGMKKGIVEDIQWTGKSHFHVVSKNQDIGVVTVPYHTD